MARSDSRDFKLNRDELIKRSFNILGLYDLRQSIPYEDNKFASDMLNAMIKQMQAEGLHLWNRRQATLFTAKNTASYDLGSNGTHATNSYLSTQLNGAASSGAGTLTVDDTTGMTAADNIGIELSDGTRQWTTITSVDSSTALTIDTNLTGAAPDNGYVVTYTTKINRPLLILHCMQGSLADNTEIEMAPYRYNDYFSVSDKTAAGRPNRHLYDKQLDEGKLYLWPRPDNVDYIVNFAYYDTIEDVDTATNNFDYPSEWTTVLMWSLAAELAPAYGMQEQEQALTQKAMYLKQRAQEFNYDEEPIRLFPDLEGKFSAY